MNLDPTLYNKIRKIIMKAETTEGISFLVVLGEIKKLKKKGVYTEDQIDNTLNNVLTQEMLIQKGMFYVKAA